MKRLQTITAIISLLGFVSWFYYEGSTSDARKAKPFARKFAEELRKDPRFNKIEVGVWELGSKGPVYVRGTVASDSDVTELRRRFEALGCPAGVSWQLTVTTNSISISDR